MLFRSSDIVFAVDSIPAILAITTDPFVVYTSNVFAILGLRALYFALAGVMEVFHYLHYGLSFILAFVGVKMLLADIYKIPVPVAPGVVAVILAGSVILSLLRPPVAGAVVAVMKAREIGAVHREAAHGLLELVEPVQVQQQRKYAVGERVRLRPQPLVNHRPRVEHAGGRRHTTSSATTGRVAPERT